MWTKREMQKEKIVWKPSHTLDTITLTIKKPVVMVVVICNIEMWKYGYNYTNEYI